MRFNNFPNKVFFAPMSKATLSLQIVYKENQIIGQLHLNMPLSRKI